MSRNDRIFFGALIVGGAMLAAAFAFAQQPNNEAQAIGQKLIAEINLNIQCNTSLLTLQQEVKRLKDKYEPEAKKD